ncbi:MAG TPA: UDP-N-acetylmuramoyl-L-alanine--D-glutamate ligase [Desulfobulbus sp.]|nr:UDP-N-acetylmuramoyl-L-alanine--D-glutamate ligase [Desulfobulbus sp.]HHD64659.1 UDP-N-acetylmuramoyl-L-alanine--D-glutamate ligase [Desulfobulbaceae bacterium]
MKLVRGKRAVVLGLGVSGMAVVRYLREQGLTTTVSEYRLRKDFSKEELALVEGLQLETGGHSDEFVLRNDYIIASPGVPLDLPVLCKARERGIPIVGELALAAGEIPVPVIAVTGSNGKTTVTGLIGELLRAGGYQPFVGGNIGTPLLSYLLSPKGYDVLVLELSSFQLDLSGDFRPDIALLLNLSPDHLDRHQSMEEYTKAKCRIFSNQQKGDRAILGADDPLVMAQAGEIRAAVSTFGDNRNAQAGVVEDRVHVSVDGGQSCFELQKTGLNSGVNRLNAAAAILAAKHFGVSDERIRRGLAVYSVPEHRMTRVAEIDGVSFINDSKATNVGAMAAAIQSCPAGMVLIAGGRDKAGDFTGLRELVASRVDHMLCLGEAGPLLMKIFVDVVTVEQVEDMRAAVARAAVLAGPGQTVLLAPGCASFDMFSDYAERGRVFTACVQALFSTGEERDNDKDMLRL